MQKIKTVFNWRTGQHSAKKNKLNTPNALLVGFFRGLVWRASNSIFLTATFMPIS
jgi:hypothetical protein